MSRQNSLTKTRSRRRARTRIKLAGTAERPRLTCYISNRQVSAQLIDDVSAHTLGSINSSTLPADTTLVAKAAWVGEQIAKKAKAGKIDRVVFDRGGRRYHGRVKALAEAARSAGLEF